MSSPSKKTYNFKDEREKVKKNDIMIFKKIFVKVKTKKLSFFSINMKPVDQYVELLKYKTKIINPSKKFDIYTFFTIDDTNFSHIKELRIDIKSLTNFNRPEFLFIPEEDV